MNWLYANLVLVALGALFLVRNELVFRHHKRRIDECHYKNMARINSGDYRFQPYDHERNGSYLADVLDLRKWSYADFYGDGSFKE